MTDEASVPLQATQGIQIDAERVITAQRGRLDQLLHEACLSEALMNQQQEQIRFLLLRIEQLEAEQNATLAAQAAPPAESVEAPQADEASSS